MPAMFDFDVLKISDVQSNDDGPDVFGLNMVPSIPSSSRSDPVETVLND